MVQAYLSHSDEISGARDPLYRASELGDARSVQGMLTFMPVKDDEGEKHA